MNQTNNQMSLKRTHIDAIEQNLFEVLQKLPDALKHDCKDSYEFYMPLIISSKARKTAVYLNWGDRHADAIDIAEVMTEMAHQILPLHHKKFKQRSWSFMNRMETTRISFELIGEQSEYNHFWVQVSIKKTDEPTD